MLDSGGNVMGPGLRRRHGPCVKDLGLELGRRIKQKQLAYLPSGLKFNIGHAEAPSV